MKMLKTLLVCLLLLALPLHALGAGMDMAAAPADTAALCRYPSFEQDEATGRWTVRSLHADGLVDRFLAWGGANSGALCVFHVALEGDGLTGLRQPVLRFYYMNGKALGATAVSIVADGVRYDLAAGTRVMQQGRKTVEIISAPLWGHGLSVPEALSRADKVTVRLLGNNVYTTQLIQNSVNERRQVEGASLAGMEAGLALMEQAGLESYELWDLNAAAWEESWGFAPACQRTIVEKTVCGVATEDEFGMVIAGERSRAAKAAMEAMEAAGYMIGASGNLLNAQAVQAVRRAQKYLGLIETGAVDAQTMRAVEAGPAQAASAAPGQDMAALGSVRIGLNRCWFAPGVSASRGGDSLRTPANSDNLLFVADGLMENLAAEELRLFMDVEAQVIYDGQWAYDAVMVVERDGGSQLDMALLPLGQSRLIVYAEVPAQLSEAAPELWRVVISGGEESLEFTLE